jgi:hypothetical protein
MMGIGAALTEDQRVIVFNFEVAASVTYLAMPSTERVLLRQLDEDLLSSNDSGTSGLSFIL